MFRVADCPLSPLQNRRGIVDMRVMSTEITVHGDPIMWSPSDSPERVAQQFVASLLGVPQLSVRLADLSPAHRDVVAHWLRFWNDHASLLLHAPLSVTGVDRDYSTVVASADGATVTVRYGDGAVQAPGAAQVWQVANGGERGVVVVDLDAWGDVDIEMRDARGRIVDAGRRRFDAAAFIDIPAGGRLTVSTAV
jgi:alpha-galactosidase